MNGTCAECKREGEVIPQAVANAKNEIGIRYLHVACVPKWLEKYHAWRDGLTQKANGASNADDDDSNGCLSDACPSLVCLPEGVCAPAGSVSRR